MKFAMFYEIPVPRPWDEESAHRAYKAVIEEPVFGEQAIEMFKAYEATGCDVASAS